MLFLVCVSQTVKRGVALLHCGQRDAAEKLFEFVFAEDVEEYADLYLDVGDAYLACNLNDKAATVFQSVQTSAPACDTPELWVRS